MFCVPQILGELSFVKVSFLFESWTQMFIGYNFFDFLKTVDFV